MTTDRNTRMAPIQVPMPLDLINRVEEAAFNAGMTSRAAFIRLAIESHLAQPQRAPQKAA